MLHENASCSVLNISVSTHKPLLIIMPVSLNHHTDTSAQVKNLRIHNVTEKTIEQFSGEFIHYMDGFKHDLSDITDKNCLRNVFPDFYSNLTDIYNRSLIVDKSFESRRNVYDKPTSLAKCRKEKNRLHNVWIKSRRSCYENLAKLNYESYRRILRGLIRKSENDYYTCPNLIKLAEIYAKRGPL